MRHFLGGKGSNLVHVQMGRFRQSRSIVAVGFIKVADLPGLHPMVADLIQIRRQVLNKVTLILLAVGPP
jgi:hypothetical protein